MTVSSQQPEPVASGQVTNSPVSSGSAGPAAASTQGAPPLVVAPKNPAVSALISALFPGIGSVVNGDVGVGIAIFVAYVFSALLMLFIIGFLLTPIVWIFGMVHAYNGAKEWNLQHGIVS